MVHLSSIWWRLISPFLVTVLTLRYLLILLLRTVIRQVALFATAETLVGGVRGTSLYGGGIGVPLAWCLLTTLLLNLLLMMLKLVALLVWTMVPLIKWTRSAT